MTYSPTLSSAFHDTFHRSRHISPQSGMCSICTEECEGTCEIALAAVLGARTVYPTNTGANQIGAEKDFPIDYSHFNINGRVFGALGANLKFDEANIHNVDLTRSYGRFHPVTMDLPIILPALIKMNWQDYFAGAAMAGIPCVIGEDARTKDPDLELENGKVISFPALKGMLDAFRQYDRGRGQIILQCNIEDDAMGVPEIAIQEHGCEAIELKFGQGAKGTQPVNRLKNRQEALAKQAMGHFILPDPMDPVIIKADEEGGCPNFYIYARLPLWDETYLIPRIRQLRELGAKNIYLKMAGYDRQDIERVMLLGSDAEVDMITFDGAGGGSGYSPVHMMNEWGLPVVVLQQVVLEIARDMKQQDRYVPALTITGGFSKEDQVFKALAYGENHFTAVGVARAAMAAAMPAKRIGTRIQSGDVPKHIQKYGSTMEQVFGDLPELRAIYGKAADNFSPGAIGVFSYLNKLGFGIKHFAALNRKFNIDLLDQTDLIPLTRDAKDVIKGRWFD